MSNSIPRRGVFGRSVNGHGVYGEGGIGVYGNGQFGVAGYTDSLDGIGVFGNAEGGGLSGVLGQSYRGSGRGVFGRARHTTGINYAVYGLTDSPNGYAGFFDGRVHVVGTLSKGGGSFKIDHPLDPANKYLYHSFVESPDMMNVYNGNISLDSRGEAWVVMPEWFEALNKDFRYQLTAIGKPGPNLFVAEEIAGNRFKIEGGNPGMKVSWQVTGIRKDAFAEKNRIPVEEEKTGEERGRYMHPEAFGLSKDRGITWPHRAGLPEPANGQQRKDGSDHNNDK